MSLLDAEGKTFACPRSRARVHKSIADSAGARRRGSGWGHKGHTGHTGHTVHTDHKDHTDHLDYPVHIYISSLRAGSYEDKPTQLLCIGLVDGTPLASSDADDFTPMTSTGQ